MTQAIAPVEVVYVTLNWPEALVAPPAGLTLPQPTVLEEITSTSPATGCPAAFVTEAVTTDVFVPLPDRIAGDAATATESLAFCPIGPAPCIPFEASMAVTVQVPTVVLAV
jgi:hypothetical protein